MKQEEHFEHVTVPITGRKRKANDDSQHQLGHPPATNESINSPTNCDGSNSLDLNNNSNEDDSNNIKSWDQMMEEAAALSGARRARKRFVGVRQRPSGRWVAEIKDTIQKIRVWLGTYDTTEEAARAYDEAACLLRGANTRTNFWPCSSPNSKPVLPPKITNLLLHRLKARNRDLATERIAGAQSPTPKSIDYPSEEHNVEMDENTHLDGFLSSAGNGQYDDNNYSKTVVENSYHAAVANKISDDGTFGDDGYHAVTNSNNRDWFATFGDGNKDNSDDRGSNAGKGDQAGMSMENIMIDFHQFDDLKCSSRGSGTTASGYQQPYSAFDIAQEMMEPLSKHMDDPNQAAGGLDHRAEEPLALSEISKRLNYERKFSASLYAYSGVTECLSRTTRHHHHRSTLQTPRSSSDQVATKTMRIGDHSMVHDLKGSSKEEEEGKNLNGRNGNHLNNVSRCSTNTEAASSSSSNVEEDGELSLWSSLDLPSLCFNI